MGNLIGTFLGPIGTIFNAIFYEPIYNLLMLIYNLIHATGIYGGFGLSIIALTLLVRCAMIPLTRKQLKSSRAMQELAPQLNALKVQYRGDPQGLMKAQQDLYKEHGYSPVSGCLPLLIQMPFLYALLFAFRTLLTENLHKINAAIYPFLPHLAQIPNGLFLWTDLGKADPWHILPFLAAFFTLVQLRMAMPVRKKPAPGTPTDPTMQATQTTMYIMPLITLFFAWNFPSGLALYWTVGAIFASVQQYFLAGWGSLFVGIPGFEHLVPPPKELPSATPGGGTAGLGRAGARSLVAASSSSPSPASESPSPGGLRGLFRQMREMGAAAQVQAEEAAKARRDGKAAGTEASGGAESGKKTDAGATSSTANRRTRPPATKEGPRLVKPSQTAQPPERALQKDATTPSNGSAAVPSASQSAQAGSTGNSAKNGKNGSNGNSGPLRELPVARGAKSNGTGTGAPTSRSGDLTTRRPATASTKSGHGSSPASIRRTSAANSKASSSSSSNRNRSANRSKGGR